ncbi:splicing factor Prp14 (nucleomorph) [Lotharella oceanica]|uniref:Splicing factor Prp14 n=1 Tax=Lotharella oceanica TaxID=641309 RepID=A0A060D6M5_9EUKA|nr:splicing factor Prp14 [Lotharella oceanica]|mmetsp:Transcript_3295/g.6409  ORF Transcript_3295/g.6409 Transcript_3295/m.6409 type:complete len:90 (+) Transcript_3295:348-617(+)
MVTKDVILKSIIYMRNLPRDITLIELQTLLDEFGLIYQIRMGFTHQTRGTAFVVFQNSNHALHARMKLNGKNYRGKYIIVLQLNHDLPN